MKAIISILALTLAIAPSGRALAEGEPKSRTECADMKEMIWDSATQTCNPIAPTKDPGDTPASSSPPGQPIDSETSDRMPEKPTPSGFERDRTTPVDPASKTPRAPDEMEK